MILPELFGSVLAGYALEDLGAAWVFVLELCEAVSLAIYFLVRLPSQFPIPHPHFPLQEKMKEKAKREGLAALGWGRLASSPGEEGHLAVG